MPYLYLPAGLCVQSGEAEGIPGKEDMATTTDPIIQDGELTTKAAFIFGKILGAWIAYREDHDFDEKETLFQALAEYEKLMRSDTPLRKASYIKWLKT